ncbi:MAG: hypothetical protein NXI32_04940 [bacterium]|nr:hypothetical protein [bacterium]
MSIKTRVNGEWVDGVVDLKRDPIEKAAWEAIDYIYNEWWTIDSYLSYECLGLMDNHFGQDKWTVEQLNAVHALVHKHLS